MIQPQAAPSMLAPRSSHFQTLPRSRTIRFGTTLAMPIQLQASIRIANPGAGSGVRGVLDGAVVLGGLSAVLSHSCGSGMREVDDGGVASEVMLVPAGDWFAMPPSRFHALIAESSPVQIQFRDCWSEPLTEALSLGTLGERSPNFCVSLRAPVAVLVEIATDDRSFGPGSQATISGRFVFPRGILGRVIFRREDGCGEDGEPLAGGADLLAVGIDQEIRFVKRLKLTPAPARPLKSIAFLDGYGQGFGSNGASHQSQGVLRYDGARDS